MSESTGAGGGAAPSPGTGAPGGEAGGGEGATPVTGPMGNRLREGISINDAVGELTERRKKAAAAPRQSPAAPEPPPARPPAAPAAPPARANGQTPPPGANGHAAPPGGSASDPVDALIRAYRDQHAPPATPGTQTDPPATAPATPPATTGGMRLTIDGKATDFTADQLTAAVMRSNDYTKKTQELAEFSRKVNLQAETINRLLPQIIPEVERQIAAIDQQLGAKVDWQKLAREDPAEYQRQDALYKEAAAERERLAGLAALNEQENAAARDRRIREGHVQLAKVIPGWDDPTQRSVIQGKMKEWGLQNGFTAQELGNVYEPRHVVTLFKALAFDRLMQNVRTAAPVVPQVNGRGAPPTLQQQGAAGDAERAFSERPSVKNATSLLIARRRALN